MEILDCLSQIIGRIRVIMTFEEFKTLVGFDIKYLEEICKRQYDYCKIVKEIYPNSHKFIV